MFQDVVSNLSLSPAATGQLSFYWRRLQREQLTRSLAMVMASALVLLQIATMVAPADAANNDSSNNIIANGLPASHPKSSMLEIYDNNAEIRAILNRYGVYKEDLKKAEPGTLNSSNHKLKSLGRNPHNSAYDEPVTIAGHTYYLRALYSWGDNVTYKALEGRRHGDNKYFAILYRCGNLVITDTTPSSPGPQVISQKPQPITTTPAPKPKPKPQAPGTVTPPDTFGTVTRPPSGGSVTPPGGQGTTNIPTTPTVTPGATIGQRKSGTIIATDGSKRDANGATAQPGETIEYTLTTSNTGAGSAKDYVVQDNINDTLEYADLVDPRGGVLTGGTLSWPKTTIAAGGSYIATYAVRVKNPLPATPASSSDPQSFDLVIDNVYGTLVSTHLAAPTAAKALETATTTLPQTGAGTTTLVVLLMTGGITYFYLRNRQLVTEVAMLRGDHHGKGGHR